MQNIIDINVESHKQQIRLNKDDNRIIELDLADPNILQRLSAGVERIEALMAQRENLKSGIASAETSTEEGENDLQEFIKEFAQTETQMRNILNEMFDYDVCTPFFQSASAFSVRDGVFLYETLIETLMKLYEKSIQAETVKVKSRLNKHTKKYLK